MAKDFGFTLSWNAYDISWEKDVGLPTHYLEHFYVLPTVRMDQAFISARPPNFAQ